MLRQAVVSGQFYPSNPSTLKKMLAKFVDKSQSKDKALAVISPHAGYIYSGKTAGKIFSEVEIPDTILLLGPNHTGIGKPFSIMRNGVWETPLGNVSINEELALLVKKNFLLADDDIYAHLREHSLEVQLPFLQFINPNISIVPITIMNGNYRHLKALGEAVAKAIITFKKQVLIVISSDMTHYETHESAKNKDSIAIEKILNFDAEGLLMVCREFNITMCGVFPAVAGIEAVKILGAKSATLSSYTTSGETSGDYKHVVGYAGIKFL